MIHEDNEPGRRPPAGVTYAVMLIGCAMISTVLSVTFTWMWDYSTRIRRIHDMLMAESRLTVDSMQRIQLDAHDKGAEGFVPVLLRDVPESALDDPFARRVRSELAAWNYVADTQSIGTLIYIRWYNRFCAAVWDNKWPKYGIVQPAGAWGFNDTNRRYPIPEVLEFLTRERPNSHWFDDLSTPERETRREIMLRTFLATVKSLRAERGDDLENWRWGKINVVSVPSLSQQAFLARSGGPTVGTPYTANPGGDIGPVSGGASWRMIVDFAHVDRSVGSLPGGQSEDAQSPHYSDLLKPWADGQYFPLCLANHPRFLPSECRARILKLSP